MLTSCEKELVVLVEADGKRLIEAYLEPARCEVRDRKKGVGGIVHNGNLAYEGAKIDEVGACEAGIVSEGDLERTGPGLWNEIELCCRCWADNG